MAKNPRNAERFPVEWDGDVKGGESQGDEIPTSVSTVWGSNPYTWSDVALAIEVADVVKKAGSSYKRRKENLDKLLKDTDKKKKLIHLICRIKGEKVYDDYTEVKNVEVDVDDVELVVETIVKKVKLEIKENV